MVKRKLLKLAFPTPLPYEDIKKIPFVALPFGTKPTRLVPILAPRQLNFDPLWNPAFYPELIAFKTLNNRLSSLIGFRGNDN